MSEQIQSTVEWAQDHGVHYAGYIHLDNYDPPRQQERVECYRYAVDDTPTGWAWVITHCESLLSGDKAIYLMDDDESIVPHYVATYDTDPAREVFVAVRPMTGVPFGPRRCYHVKLHALHRLYGGNVQ